MPAANPLTDTERATIAAMHANGSSCNAIAKHLGRAASTISRAAATAGLTWDTGQTRAATEVKVASNRERRAATIARLYDRAGAILNRLEARQFKVVGFDRDGNARVTSIDCDAIPGTEERALSGMAVNLLVAAARLEAVDAGNTSTGEAKGILGGLQEALHAAYGQLSHTSTPTAELADATET